MASSFGSCEPALFVTALHADLHSFIHGLGIFFFTKGFLLTRLVLDQKSECASPPIEVPTPNLGTYTNGCWHPKSFDKAVIIIIDALRYDFTVPYHGEPHHFHNALKVLHETATQTPQNSFLLPFIADPPTATLQRLKGLTTGTLPTFIDAGSNFAGTAIDEDNLVAQLRDAGKTLVHLGDDTWHSLFPGYFDANLTHAYDSFNVWDLYTVDNGVTEHLMPLLGKGNRDKWDVIFGHYLGVDHAGHRYGPDHPTTRAKLQEMDDVIREMIASLDDDTLLVVMGDHGMDVKGDHGGESDDEVEAALWMYSKKGVFGRGHNGMIEPPPTAKERPIGQIDLVPTLSLLLGMPIPFNNLGAPISEVFVGHGRPDWQNLATVNALAAAQISNYQHEYSRARGLEEGTFAEPQSRWALGLQSWEPALKDPKNADYKAIYQAFSEYQHGTLKICRSLWARFDVPSMIEGIAILAFGVVFLTIFARSSSLAGPDSAPLYLGQMSLLGGVCSIVALGVEYFFTNAVSINAALLGLASGGVAGIVLAMTTIRQHISLPMPTSIWGWLALVFTLSQSIGFASNSYTIWEDEILLLFLSSFAVVALISSIRHESSLERTLGITQSVTFLVLTRFVALSRLCREEQMPYCRSTYYASSASSTSAPWQLVIPLLAATILPLAIKRYYQRTKSYEGSATIWIGFVLRLSLLCTAVFWILDAADDNDWLSLEKTTLKTIRVVIARIVLGIAFVVGTSTFVYWQPCISIKLGSSDEDAEDKSLPSNPKSVKMYGYANVHGSRYYLLIATLLIALTLVQKPMGNGALCILAIQILALLEILSVNQISHTAIGPIILGLLGNFHFFKTGHQAAPASIQWETAFIPLSTIRYPWSPLLIILNTCGAQILTAAAVPLVVLWKQPPVNKGRNLLVDVARAVATFILYHAVINLATTMWAGHLRRHLMLYRIFSPRFMIAAVVVLVVDLVCATVALGAVWFNSNRVAEVFGWA